MRLDKLISEAGLLSRKETARAAKDGRLTVNGAVMRRADGHIDPDRDVICLDGTQICYHQYDYVWLNKPAGYVSATEDGRLPCVTDLLPPPLCKRGLFPCGRLDKDTTGLMLLTNDGALSHRLLSPRRHVTKVYRFTCEPALPEGAEAAMAAGLTIDGGEQCKPALLCCDTGRCSGEITLTEGKYHQIKRMTEALGSRVTALQRIAFAGVALDPDLAPGQLRTLTNEEIEALHHAID